MRARQSCYPIRYSLTLLYRSSRSASGVHGLPIVDSDTKLLLAHSHLKHEGGVALEPSKHATHTSPLTRQPDGDGGAYQSLLTGDTGELKLSVIPQRNVLTKRAPFNIVDEAVKGEELVHDLSPATSSRSPTVPDGTALRLLESPSEASSSGSTSDQLSKSVVTGTDEQATEIADLADTNKHSSEYGEHWPAEDRWSIAHHTLQALKKARPGDPNRSHIPGLMEEHKARYYVAHDDWLRHKRFSLSHNEVQSEEPARALLSKIKGIHELNRQELLQQKEREITLIDALDKALSEEKWRSATRKGLGASRRLALERKVAIEKRLNDLAEHTGET